VIISSEADVVVSSFLRTLFNFLFAFLENSGGSGGRDLMSVIWLMCFRMEVVEVGSRLYQESHSQ